MPLFNPVVYSTVALNFQTPGYEMDLNTGRFLINGQCGYVLKPAYLRQHNTTFDPECPGPPRTTLTVQVSSLPGPRLHLRSRLAQGRYQSEGKKDKGGQEWAWHEGSPPTGGHLCRRDSVSVRTRDLELQRGKGGYGSQWGTGRSCPSSLPPLGVNCPAAPQAECREAQLHCGSSGACGDPRGA